VVTRSPIARLTDIIEAIERMQDVLRDMPLTTFAADWRARWVVERGAEIIFEASRRLPSETKASHPEIGLVEGGGHRQCAATRLPGGLGPDYVGFGAG
jgi:uncharacterized protein with HEPN domain